MSRKKTVAHGQSAARCGEKEIRGVSSLVIRRATAGDRGPPRGCGGRAHDRGVSEGATSNCIPRGVGSHRGRRGRGRERRGAKDKEGYAEGGESPGIASVGSAKMRGRSSRDAGRSDGLDTHHTTW